MNDTRSLSIGSAVLAPVLAGAGPALVAVLPFVAIGLAAVAVVKLLEDDPPSYHAVRRFVVRTHGQNELPFRRLECAPGQELQVDFGRGAWVVEGGPTAPAACVSLGSSLFSMEWLVVCGRDA
jgi:hypothetical protein